MNPASRTALLFIATTVAAVVATFAALDRWVDAKRHPDRPLTRTEVTSIPAPGVDVEIDATPERVASWVRGRSFAPTFVVRESTRERLRLECRFVEDEIGAFTFMTELVVNRSADGNLSGTLAQRSCGGCFRMGDGRGFESPPKARSARVVLTGDWMGGGEEYGCAIYGRTADGIEYERTPTWYCVRP